NVLTDGATNEYAQNGFFGLSSSGDYRSYSPTFPHLKGYDSSSNDFGFGPLVCNGCGGSTVASTKDLVDTTELYSTSSDSTDLGARSFYVDDGSNPFYLLQINSFTAEGLSELGSAILALKLDRVARAWTSGKIKQLVIDVTNAEGMNYATMAYAFFACFGDDHQLPEFRMLDNSYTHEMLIDEVGPFQDKWVFVDPESAETIRNPSSLFADDNVESLATDVYSDTFVPLIIPMEEFESVWYTAQDWTTSRLYKSLDQLFDTPILLVDGTARDACGAFVTAAASNNLATIVSMGDSTTPSSVQAAVSVGTVPFLSSDLE
ncbi:hypothetical protein KIPB_009996, partial [Kipferlia bialata]